VVTESVKRGVRRRYGEVESIHKPAGQRHYGGLGGIERNVQDRATDQEVAGSNPAERTQKCRSAGCRPHRDRRDDPPRT
jgi:hypothetical protein